ncbi:hypothetical protein L1887_35189 [Cichorium endivia]|nr:hypothetical protein L1887_35189 [Cichorium endivia]
MINRLYSRSVGVCRRSHAPGRQPVPRVAPYINKQINNSEFNEYNFFRKVNCNNYSRRSLQLLRRSLLKLASIMASERQRLEDGSNHDYGSELNTSPTDELAAVSDLARSAGELMIIQTLQRFIEPVLVPILKPLIRQIVTEQIGLAKQELLASMKENPANQATTSVPKRLKLQFRNRIALPVFTGKRLLGENESTIEIALVDAITEQIMNTGPESTAKLEIVGFCVGDDGSVDDRWKLEDFQQMILSGKKGKRILQGDTCLQLKEGVCFVSKISFTHNSENTKNGWYRLGAGVVDAALMNRVEVARTEPFLMKDGRTAYYEKHPHPRLSDKVCHLQQISYKGSRHGRLKDAGLFTVKDLLTLLYKDQKRLQDVDTYCSYLFYSSVDVIGDC